MAYYDNEDDNSGMDAEDLSVGEARRELESRHRFSECKLDLVHQHSVVFSANSVF